MAADHTAEAKKAGAPAKPHGDTLTPSTGTGKTLPESQPVTGDSPKRQGDPMAATIKGK